MSRASSRFHSRHRSSTFSITLRRSAVSKSRSSAWLHRRVTSEMHRPWIDDCSYSSSIAGGASVMCYASPARAAPTSTASMLTRCEPHITQSTNGPSAIRAGA